MRGISLFWDPEQRGTQMDPLDDSEQVLRSESRTYR